VVAIVVIILEGGARVSNWYDPIIFNGYGEKFPENFTGLKTGHCKCRTSD
jgi:hypothetical protein